MKDEYSNINFLLVVLLHNCSRAVNKVRQREISAFGMTASQSAIIRAIIRWGEEATSSKISEQLFLEPHSVSEQLKRMAKEGLIIKTRNQDKTRTIRLEVTEKGLELHKNTLVLDYSDRIMSVLTEEEKNELWSLLSKVRGQAAKELGMRPDDYYPPSRPKNK